ncbi:hypothetical protein COU00_01235 [Candidatus Falkowbacteria bacterium CG10_big_fil_rev_8_21_14_0_10_43_11]|uniref:Uncharacterized protein n=1 Tax=Candidatus Falkowbacteria bacterium CG10_big_fil_rev_8_21_14_0_10_43_11 TaxID=1974568 RepID=A0A2M6WMJ6_9BACT|nr:MAG: hypothetical protein COU00_01235 [Candidatus Falkowbacteria bacterium CG10_big_fil_rev_8_21_14_0_10_43_11]
MKSNTYIIIREIFYILTIALSCFILLEIFFPNIVQAYFSLNFVLILWLISGIVVIVAKLKVKS